jgi:hypothetical protein
MWIPLHAFFFYFSALGAGAAPKALVGADLLAVGGVCLGDAIATVTKGSACPGVVAAVPVEGSTMMEGTSCSFTISSSTVSLTLCLACFGFGELGLKN